MPVQMKSVNKKSTQMEEMRAMPMPKRGIPKSFSPTNTSADQDTTRRKIAIPKQHADTDDLAVPAAGVPRAIKIDKLTLAVLLEDVSLDERNVVTSVLDRLKREGKLYKGSAKGRGFKNVYVKTYKDNFSIEVRVNPTRELHSRQFMNITFNPSLMDEKRVKWFGRLLRMLFPGRRSEMMRQLRLYRCDVCVDIPEDINQLIVRLRRCTVQSKYFMATDSVGRVETMYLGSIASDLHGVVYDQQASDAFKQAVGETTSLPPLERNRTKSRDDAEVVLQRTRFEARRVFKDLPTLDVLDEWTAPFDRWDVWQIRDVPALRKDWEFAAYLDAVRWRGVAGARLYLEGRGCEHVSRFEQQLDRYKADWWRPERMLLDMQSALRSRLLWKLLRG
ncbi:hypothetical protein [Noviherbaspirillum sp. UKPF54]|uniref:hypothetical protein n=1 Tax=Noviherbaspirillum sp. UKPF54 TaxID=2601898 RepID=UPI0011B15BD2|nr:hypothetical protein [Noviherbaspirillum sp. UKPF54]QDZ29578.1 hypothetical protein FAY22_17380 [Noviherbaspirillum sp. UKPF54]